MGAKSKILFVEAQFYPEMTAALHDGAVQAVEAAGANYEAIAVPGVLEIPTAIKYAHETGNYDAYVALGVVIRGETYHFDLVCNESARALMDLGVQYGLAIGNGIQTVENEAQAWARVRMSEKNKGGGAAQAALRLWELKEHYGLSR